MANMDEETDESLLGRIVDGDQQAFASLVRRHTRRFHAAAYRMCGDGTESEDIVQDAFLKLWEKPQSWNAAKGVKFTTWFYRVVTNLAIDRMRKKKALPAGDAMERMVDTAPGQDQALYEKQRENALEQAVQSLPERQKTALNLCFYEELSNREAADIMGVSVKALESLLIRAKAALKDELTRKGVLGMPPARRVSHG